MAKINLVPTLLLRTVGVGTLLFDPSRCGKEDKRFIYLNGFLFGNIKKSFNETQPPYLKDTSTTFDKSREKEQIRIGSG